MAWFNFLFNIGNYELRKIGRIEWKENERIGVSTAYTFDEGYETALFDANGVYPVERYISKKKAEIGHKKWGKFIKKGDGKEIISLDDNKKIKLSYRRS